MLAYFSANLTFPKENYHSTNRKQCKAKKKKKEKVAHSGWAYSSSFPPTLCSPCSCEGSALQHSWFQVYHRGQRSNKHYIRGGVGNQYQKKTCIYVQNSKKEYQINAWTPALNQSTFVLCFCQNPPYPKRNIPIHLLQTDTLEGTYTAKHVTIHRDTEDTKCYTYNTAKALINHHHCLLQK